MGDKVQIILVLTLVFALLVAVFAISNAGKVDIRFFGTVYSVSQAIVILGAAAFGALVTLLLGLISRIRMAFKIRELNAKVSALEKQLGDAKREIEMLRTADCKQGNGNIEP
ncbi:LapA family protein [Thermovorax subterraneus]|nr:LapA family protein [Thermovorax subterraneus]